MQVGATESQLHVSHVESTKRDVIMARPSATAVSKEALRIGVSTTLRLSPNLATRMMKRERVNHDR
jgi:hypothetical protein